MKQRDKIIYLCDNCGNEFSSWSGRCSACGEWNTLKEMKSSKFKIDVRAQAQEVEIKKLDEIDIQQTNRKSSGIEELDRVLGGGVVPGSVILLGGEPGIGKSTLLLQMAGNFGKVLYLSAEESLGQIKLRADRIGIKNKDLSLLSTWDLEVATDEAQKNQVDLFIVDSIQTVALSSCDGTPGNMLQVRECGIFLQQFAKRTGIPVLIIGHVTKDGNIAGPRMLEHLVDVVLYLEGDRFHEIRILRGIKNRFGSTDEAGIFSLQAKGMVEVKNPSEIFLSERKNEPGSVVTATIEGTRPILLEVQSLVNTTRFGYPQRTVSGFDLNRLNLLIAVISKKTPVNLSNFDIFINIVGGFKTKDPAVDLAVCAAIISSCKNIPIKSNICLFGEVGLSGEIRKVTRQNERGKEAKKLGYNIIENISDLNSLAKELKLIG